MPQTAVRFDDVVVEMIGQRNVDGYTVLDLKVTMVNNFFIIQLLKQLK
jgi:hypothetical protein